MNNFKVGDKVYTKEYGSYSLGVVERLTKTQVVTSIGKFRYDGGIVGGNSWHNLWLNPLTQEIGRKIEIKKLKDKITSINLNRLIITENNIDECNNLLKSLESLIKFNNNE